MPSTADVAAEQRRLGRLLEASGSHGVGRDLSARSWVFDALIAAVFIALGYLLLQVFSVRADLDDALFVVLVNAPLALRRRLPRVGFGLVLACGVLQMLLGVPIGLHDAGLLFAIYSVVGHTNHRTGLVVLAVGGLAVLVGSATDWWIYVDQRLAEPSALVRVLSALGAAGLVLAAWALGERLRSSRLGVLALQERAAQFERERRQQAQLAAAAERARIAREMHDVIAHGLSVMIVQADGAAYVVDQEPERAKEALAEVSRTGRQSLAEMRNLLGLLRNDALESSEDGLPQPGLDDVVALLAEARALGAEVSLTETGTRRPHQSMVELTAYRILQEGLTNARKHGGPTVAITLAHESVENGRAGLTVEIGNDARESAENLTQERGHGLTGMAERVAAVEGTLALGPTKDSGFDVVAWLPYRDPGVTAEPTRDPGVTAGRTREGDSHDD